MLTYKSEYMNIIRNTRLVNANNASGINANISSSRKHLEWNPRLSTVLSRCHKSDNFRRSNMGNKTAVRDHNRFHGWRLLKKNINIMQGNSINRLGICYFNQQ
jgi:hypothetical protein